MAGQQLRPPPSEEPAWHSGGVPLYQTSIDPCKPLPTRLPIVSRPILYLRSTSVRSKLYKLLLS